MLAVLRIPAFRRLWLALGLSSLGDWLGLLATSLFARSLFEGSAAQGAAFGGVIAVRLLPALVLFPFAGVMADRFDRRLTMVVCDVLRFVLFASIPVAGFLLGNVQAVTWALIATFLIETITMFWMPAKEAAVPNLVPGRVEAANQLSLITTYALTPVLAALLLAGLTRAMLALVGDDASRLALSPVDVALFVNALTFLAAAVVVWTIPDIGRPQPGVRSRRPGLVGALADGWRFLRQSEMVRGLVLGIVGAFAAGGVVVGVAPLYAASLGGGDASFAVLFALLFVGLGLGMAVGPKVVRTLSRKRWFGMSIVLAGASVTALSLAPHLAVAVPLTILVGMGAGMAFLAGTTLLGTEVEDDVRGRTFAFVQTAVRVVLLLSITLGSVLGGLGGTRRIGGPGFPHLDINASRILLFVAGVLAVGAGVLAFRRMDDRPGVPVLQDLYAAVTGRPLGLPQERSGDGVFIVFEGGEGAGKSTQAVKLAASLRMQGRECVLTREPGATQVGARIRGILLDKSSQGLAPRAEALLYAADRAHHVASVIRPSLDRGDVVISDRYVDSSLAYQGAGRALATQEIGWLSDWATGGLVPDLVVLLDVDPSVGLDRVSERGEADRLELEAVTFHQRVREGFLALAAADTGRYLVLDATGDPDDIAVRVWARVQPLLGMTAGATTEDGDGRGNSNLADTGS